MRFWWGDVADKVLAASAFPDIAYGWILAVEDKTIEELEDTEGFETMDAMLHQRIMASVQGQLKNQLELAKEQKKIDAKKSGQPDKARIRGRVLSKMVLNFFVVDALETKQIQIDQFRAIKLKGDNVRLYWHDWDYVLSGIKAEHQPGEYEKEHKAYKDLKEVPELKSVIQIYNMKVVYGNEPRSFDLFRGIIEQHYSAKQSAKNASMAATDTGTSNKSHSAPPAMSATSTVCLQ